MKAVYKATLSFPAAASAQAFPWHMNGGCRGTELMTPQEQQAHIAKLQSMNPLGECQACMGTHEAELQKHAVAAKTVLPSTRTSPAR